MATCNECIHNSVCEEVNNLKCRKDFIWYRAESGCPYYKPTAEVAPKSEVAKEIFEDIDNKLSFAHSIIDAFDVLDEIKKKYTEENKE